MWVKWKLLGADGFRTKLFFRHFFWKSLEHIPSKKAVPAMHERNKKSLAIPPPLISRYVS